LSGRGLCDELITRPEESYRLCCVVVCYLETSRIGAPYIHDISSLKVKAYWLRDAPIGLTFNNCTTLYLCVLYLSEKQRLVPLTA